MGNQQGSTQQMVGARESNKRRPHPAAFTKGQKELLMTFSLGVTLQNRQCAPGASHLKTALPDSHVLRGHGTSKLLAFVPVQLVEA